MENASKYDRSNNYHDGSLRLTRNGRDYFECEWDPDTLYHPFYPGFHADIPLFEMNFMF